MKKLYTILTLIFSLCFANSSFAQSHSNFLYEAFPTIGTNQEPKVKMLKFYPVPAKDNITFEFVSGYTRGLSFEIITQIGNKMLSAPNVVSRFNLNLSTYRRGLYFYVLKDKNGKSIETGKFQVIK